MCFLPRDLEVKASKHKLMASAPLCGLLFTTAHQPMRKRETAELRNKMLNFSFDTHRMVEVLWCIVHLFHVLFVFSFSCFAVRFVHFFHFLFSFVFLFHFIFFEFLMPLCILLIQFIMVLKKGHFVKHLPRDLSKNRPLKFPIIVPTETTDCEIKFYKANKHRSVEKN